MNRLENNNFFQKNKTEIFLFSIALIIRIILLFTILWWQGVVGDFDGRPEYMFPILGGDSIDYYRLANNIKNHFKFSIPEDLFYPESLRVPGYPIFVAVVLFFTKSILAVAIVQDILAALTVALFYKFAKKFFSENVSRASAILMVFEPSGLFFSNIIMTETFFLFLFISFLYYFFSHQEKPTKFSFFVSGLILGFASLTRPIIQFLFFIFTIYIIYFYYQSDKKKLSLFLLSFLTGFGLVTFPWALRNKIIFDSWQLSSVGVFNFYNYHVPIFLSLKEGVDENVKISEFQNRFKADKIAKYEYWSLYNIDDFKKIVKKYILEDPICFTKFYLIKTLPFFLTDGLRDIFRSLKLIPPPTTNFSNLLVVGNIGQIKKIIFLGGVDLKLFIIGFAFWNFISILMLVGIIYSIISRDRDQQSFYVAFFSLLILYFAIATGPVASGRFRMQVAPLIFLLASYGFSIFFKKIKGYLNTKND